MCPGRLPWWSRASVVQLWQVRSVVLVAVVVVVVRVPAACR